MLGSHVWRIRQEDGMQKHEKVPVKLGEALGLQRPGIELAWPISVARMVGSSMTGLESPADGTQLPLFLKPSNSLSKPGKG
jgi:hypothetical protein